MAKIDRESIVGTIYANYTVLSYENKDDKGKHWYRVQFNDTKNIELSHWDLIRKGKCKDSRAIKLAKAKVEQIRLKQRNRLTKQSKHSFKPSNLHQKAILAIDLATFTTGICYAKNGQIIKSSIIQSKNDNIDVRCYEIVKKLREILIKGKIDYVILESTFLGCNSTILEKLSSIRGALIYQLTDLDIHYDLVPPNLWKNHYNMPTTRAEQKKWVLDEYKKLTDKVAETDDEADAFFMMKFALEKII